MELNGVFFERTNTLRASSSNPNMVMNSSGLLNPHLEHLNQTKQLNNSMNMSPKPRPLPQFFLEQNTFSTKKEKIRETPKLSEIYVPKPPIKSCPPISRLKTAKKLDNDRARVITFTNNNINNNYLLNTVSKHYDENKTDLFFEQCYIIEGSLGCGSFGKVYKVKSKEDGNYYAIKKSREKFKGFSDRIRKLEEVAKHEQLPPHPNCVKFYRAWEEKQRLYICLELCQTSLSAYAENHHSIPESVIWQIMIDLLQAVKHLHERKLVHMDIKPDNIFISHDGVCKLGDFGLIIDLNKADLKEADIVEGDPKYLAPEVLQSYNNITCAADVFSLGMTILELATDLDLPRSGDQWHQLRQGQVPSHLISSLSDSLVDIIMRMIEPDHLKRATANELLEMPKIKSILLKEKTSDTFYSRSLSLHPWSVFDKTRLKIKNNQSSPDTNSNDDDDDDDENNNKFKNNNKSTNSKINLLDNQANSNSTSRVEQTSTPKKSNHLDNLLCFVQTDDEDEKAHDSFSTNNNSINPIMDSSSSFSDNSDILNKNNENMDLFDRRNAKTEPPKKKTMYNKNSRAGDSPCKTPPWKPMSSLFAYGTDNTPVGPTRLKFEDNDDNGQQAVTTTTTATTTTTTATTITTTTCTATSLITNNFQSLSQSPSPTKRNNNNNNNNHDYSPSDRLCVKLNFK